MNNPFHFNVFAKKMNDGEEEDAAVRSIGPAVAPSGFTIDTNPPGRAPEDLIGSRVLFRWAGGPLRRSEYGWYISEVELIATDTQKDNDPGVTHQCLFKNTETNSKLPFRFGWRRKDAESLIPLGLTLGTWGVEKKVGGVACGLRGAAVTATATSPRGATTLAEATGLGG